jgi:hypothetical protein
MVTKDELKEAIATLEKKLRAELEMKIEMRISELKNEYEDKIKLLNTSIDNLVKENKDLNDKFENDGKVSAPKEAWNIVVGKKVLKTQSQIDIINTVTNENMEINKREKNVIIFGLEESNKTDIAEKKKDDLVSVGNLMNQVLMDEEDIVRVFRLKSKKGISPLVVEISNKENRNEFIKRSSRKPKFTLILI